MSEVIQYNVAAKPALLLASGLRGAGKAAGSTTIGGFLKKGPYWEQC
jgi:hypothetical protein